MAEKHVDFFSIIRIERNANTRRDIEIRFNNINIGLTQTLDDFFCNTSCIKASAQIGYQCNEFIAPIARNYVGCAHAFLQPLR
ncbi:MAG: hypothetical protein WCL27_06690 [Betaproteobacteria bacterium]